MLRQPYKYSHKLCLNDLLQVSLIVNIRDQVPLFRYINWAVEVYHLVIGSKVLGDIKYLMRSVERAAEAVEIWTDDNWDKKRVNSLQTMVSGSFNSKRKKMFDSLGWSSVVRYLYKRRGYIIGEIKEEQEQAWQARKKKCHTPGSRDTTLVST